MTSIFTKDLVKDFATTTAVAGIDLEIKDGELFFLLGPSGCGKTTLLRMLAGFIEPTAGTIHFDEKNVTHVPPNKRNTGMVFQSYALWPHMSVIENVKYGLNIRNYATKEQESKAMEALGIVQMEHLAKRKPNELSGGQQQRVALARSIVVEPDVLLLDEPLSNLDAKLRLEMRSEIRKICTNLRITTVYVTHDQKEALSIADRMAVLKNGKVQQVGTPQEVYQSPCSAFVAEFIGETNFIPAVGDGTKLDSAVGVLTTAHSMDGKILCSIRPEAIKVGKSDVNNFSGTCEESIYLGETAQHKVKISDSVSVRVIEVNPKSTDYTGQTMNLHALPKDIITLKKT